MNFDGTKLCSTPNSCETFAVKTAMACDVNIGLAFPGSNEPGFMPKVEYVHIILP